MAAADALTHGGVPVAPQDLFPKGLRGDLEDLAKQNKAPVQWRVKRTISLPQPLKGDFLPRFPDGLLG